MDLMDLIELHTTYAPRAGNLEPAGPTAADRFSAYRRERQARFDERGLPRGLGAL